ncbi:MAG: topoisomerase DNA-binding C4 zinc finger domain-containing protein [Holosporales bacterium]|jgi:hypothetical protein|nr:topoisomerase DNA-binding C4 zinc finger domain-containing protein [Holosporales bacterium]
MQENVNLFIKKLAKYYMDFLETNFHKRKTPKRRVIFTNSNNLKICANLSSYHSLNNEIRKFFLENYKNETFCIKKGQYSKKPTKIIFEYISKAINAIPDIDKIALDIADFLSGIISSNEKNDAESLLQTIMQRVELYYRQNVLAGFIKSIEKFLVKENINKEEIITFSLENDLSSLINNIYKDGIVETITEILSGSSVDIKEKIAKIISTDDLKNKLKAFFENLEISDLFLEVKELAQNLKIIDKQDLYLYLYNIKYKDNEYPIFYTPIAAAITSNPDKITVSFDSKIYINKKAISFIFQTYSEENERAISYNIDERIIYCGDFETKEKLSNFLKQIVSDICFSLDLEDISDNKENSSRGNLSLSVNNKAYFAIFDKSDESLVNDYEEILSLLDDKESVLSEKFTRLITDFISGDPIEYTRQIRDSWNEEDISSKLVYISPVPLNDEQRQIMKALEEEKCKYIIVEGPPGTGKSHTIVSVVFDYILKNKSVIVLSDKTEALDVVESKITDIIKKVRFSDDFPPPVLRFGAQGNNYSKIISNSSLEKIRDQLEVSKFQINKITEKLKNCSSDLENLINVSAENSQSFNLNSVEQFFELERKIKQKYENTIDIREFENPHQFDCFANDFMEFQKLIQEEYVYKHILKHEELVSFEKYIEILKYFGELIDKKIERFFELEKKIQQKYLTILDITEFKNSNQLDCFANSFIEFQKLIREEYIYKNIVLPIKKTISFNEYIELLKCFIVLVDTRSSIAENIDEFFPILNEDIYYILKKSLNEYKKITDNIFIKIRLKALFKFNRKVRELLEPITELFHLKEEAIVYYDSTFITIKTAIEVYEAISGYFQKYGGKKLFSIWKSAALFIKNDNSNIINSALFEKKCKNLSNYEKLHPDSFAMQNFDKNDIRSIEGFKVVDSECVNNYKEYLNLKQSIKKYINTPAFDFCKKLFVIWKSAQPYIEDSQPSESAIFLESELRALSDYEELHPNSFAMQNFDKNDIRSIENFKVVDSECVDNCKDYLYLRQSISDYADIPTFDFCGKRKVIEELATQKMANCLDERIMTFYDYHKTQARKIHDIIRRKRKFPRDNFNFLKEAFPCIISGIRDYAEYIPLESDIFDLLIIDEASQVSIAQAFPALLRSKKVLVFGDSKQFSNIKSMQARNEENARYLAEIRGVFRTAFKSKVEDHDCLEKFNIRTSILDFFRYISNYEIMLKKHFRGYLEHISYSNHYFYNDQIQAVKIRTKPIERILNFELIKHDGKIELTGTTNQLEADYIISELEKYLAENLSASIGIIAPHTEQRNLISKIVLNHKNSEDFFKKFKLKIMTFDSCQGEERDIIFYSMVATRELDKLNYVFIQNLSSVDLEIEGKVKAQRLNVGFSRAKEEMRFIISKPIEEFTGEIGGALRFYWNIIENQNKYGDVTKTDKNSPMEAKVLNWIHQTNWFQNNKNKIEIIPQFPVGQYLKQVSKFKQYIHPNYVVDFFVIFSEDNKKQQNIFVEYDGLEYHFEHNNNIDLSNYEYFYTEEHIYRQKVLESYGYKFIRLNRFNMADNPIEILDNKFEEITSGKQDKSLNDQIRLRAKILHENKQTGKTKDTRRSKSQNNSCLICGSKMILREGRYGKFYGCSKYPKCKYTRSTRK